MITTTSAALESIFKRTRFKNEGDGFEQQFGDLIIKEFPNCELYWLKFVVPSTNRIDKSITNPQARIRYREGVAFEIMELHAVHYSIFLNLIYAHNHLKDMRLSSFEDFYFHLGSSCDLAEEFLQKVYLLKLECLGQHSSILNNLTRDDFCAIAGKWYDKNYGGLEEHYLSKGKSIPLKLPSRKNLLDEYFGKGDSDWKSYKMFNRLIREYRNVITHQSQIGKLFSIYGKVYVPKKEVIQDYRTWHAVFSAGSDQQKFKSDFIGMTEQMTEDIATLKSLFNALWIRAIADLGNLLYVDQNHVILTKYNLTVE